MDYQTLLSNLTLITFSYISKAGKFIDLILTEESTEDEIMAVLKDATQAKAWCQTQAEQAVMHTAFTELKELMNNSGQLEEWKGSVNAPQQATSQGQFGVYLSKELKNGILGSALVNALSGSISS